jgi:hypothetical protein
MIRPLAWLAGLVLVLAASDAWLAGRERRARDEERRVGPLFQPDEAENLRKQPAFRVELAGEQHAFGRVEGQWRCLSYHKAPADARAIQSLLDGVAQAEGIVHARTAEEAPAFGINTPRTLRVSIQGPRAMQDRGGDVLATLEIGNAQGGREGCFVRKKGTPEVWSIASDLRAPLERRLAPGLPPLLEPSAVPSSWLEQGGAVRIVLARGAERTVLERRERELDPAAMQPGMLPWTWVLAGGGAPEHDLTLDVTLDEGVAGAFTGFLERLPYVAVLDAEQKDALGLATPAATVTLEPRTGAPLVLAFGTSAGEKPVALWVEAAKTLFQVSPETFRLALPAPSLLSAERAENEENPWSAALRAASAMSSAPVDASPFGAVNTFPALPR